MSRSSKNLRKAQFDEMPNCLNENLTFKGRWNEFFGNDNRLFLELGCGKGDMTLGLARLKPENNFIGTDVKAVRMWVGAMQALKDELTNVGFLRCHIESILNYFSEGELSGIWITFPDPYPKDRQVKKRMMGLQFLKRYKPLLKPGSLIKFKTDNADLFNWALEHFVEINSGTEMKVVIHGMTHDLHHSEFLDEETGIITDYERKFMEKGKRIRYVVFSLEGDE